MTDHPRPWADEGRYPTLDELDQYLRDAPPEARLEYLDRLLTATQDAARCHMADHDALLDQLQHADTRHRITLRRLDRWRRIALRRTPTVRPLP